MTPFDAVALVVMLQTFYPSVTRTSLERAFRERPEYFAGGHLFGRLSDVLILPDGRGFDIVFAAWTAASRWQAIDITTPGDGNDDLFPLDEGPLVELDVDLVVGEPGPPVFVPLVSGTIGEVYRLDELMGGAASVITTAGDPGGLPAALEADLSEAEWQHYQHARSMEGESPAELIEATGGLTNAIDGNAADVPDPGGGGSTDIPPEDPGPRPPDEPDQDGPRNPEV